MVSLSFSSDISFECNSNINIFLNNENISCLCNDIQLFNENNCLIDTSLPEDQNMSNESFDIIYLTFIIPIVVFLIFLVFISIILFFLNKKKENIISLPSQENELLIINIFEGNDGIVTIYKYNDNYVAQKTFKREDDYKDEKKILRILNENDNDVIIKLMIKPDYLGEKIGKTLYLEYLEKGDISTISPSKLNIKDLINFLIKCILYMVEKRIIHNDIAPRNIFANQMLQFKLADFGHAEKVKSLALDSADDDKILKHRNILKTDIYSIGAIIWSYFNNWKSFKNIRSDDIRIQNIPLEYKSIFYECVKKIIDRKQINELINWDKLEDNNDKYYKTPINIEKEKILYEDDIGIGKMSEYTND